MDNKEFVNLTPEVVSIAGVDGLIKPETVAINVDYEIEESIINGMAVKKYFLKKINNIPEKKENVYYIVTPEIKNFLIQKGIYRSDILTFLSTDIAWAKHPNNHKRATLKINELVDIIC